MKFKAKSFGFLSVLLASTFFYASCKKNESSTSEGTIDKKAISVQLAKSLYENFTKNAASGKKMTASVTRNGIRLNGHPLCGTSVDSVINTTLNVPGESTMSVNGKMHIKYICDESNWNAIGYTLTDSIRTQQSLPTYDYDGTVQENYTAIVKNFDYGVVTVNGTQKSHIYYDFKYNTPRITDQYNSFVLNNMVVDAYTDSGSDILSGTADFTVNGKIDNNSYNFSGEIAFLGNHKVKVSFLGEAYYVDLTSGTVTPIK